MFQDVVSPGTHHSKRSQNDADPPCSAVKSDLSSTPEQAAGHVKIDEDSRRSGTWSNTCNTPPTDVNRFIRSRRPIFRDLLVIGNWRLEAFLTWPVLDVGPTLGRDVILLGTGRSTCPGWSNHTGVPICRSSVRYPEWTCYGQDRWKPPPGTLQPHLPQRQYSYLLQQWLGSFVVDGAHAEAIRKLETILGLEFMSARRT